MVFAHKLSCKQQAGFLIFQLPPWLRFSLTSTTSLLFIGTVNSTVPVGPLRTTLFVSGRSRVSSFKCAICAAVNSLGEPISMYAE